ncbi:GNAT family N-acetyltransferase [Shewanella sp. OPT22]|nr:GNAT family N-acetyltransferase [Shewanella sp. OPT22]
MGFYVTESTPRVSEYLQLRVEAELSPKSSEAAKIGLPNSLYSICIRDESENLIGMGRVIGDGACFFQIVDMAVKPKFQGNGLGKLIMDKLEAFLTSVAVEGSYVSLIGDKPEFYERLGYKHTAPSGYGMYKKLA